MVPLESLTLRRKNGLHTSSGWAITSSLMMSKTRPRRGQSAQQLWTQYLPNCSPTVRSNQAQYPDLRKGCGKSNCTLLSKPKDMVQRCKFNARVRQPEKVSLPSVQSCAASRSTVISKTPPENMLRDRLVCGIADRAMQQRLLSEPNLTFKKAYDLAVLMESVSKDTTQLHLSRVLKYILYKNLRHVVHRQS